MLFLNIVLFCSLLSSGYVSSVPCKYIADVIAGKEDTEGVLDSPTNTQSCIAYEFNFSYNTTELEMRNSTIGILRKNAVRNMPWLTVIRCIYCEIDLIEPGAFQNVSNIFTLEFSRGVIPEIRRGIFNVLTNLGTLDLADNKINNIDDEAFSNMPALNYVHLNGNELEYWRREWFTNTTDIIRIHFSRNQLRSIPPLAFADFSRIKYIFLDNNKITKIHRDAFKGVEHLSELILANNRLKTLPDTMFPNKIRIVAFFINGNELNYISRKLLRKLTVNVLCLEGNPWKCSCLDQINFWLDLTGGRIKPLCYGPEIPVCAASLSSSCLESRDEEITRRFLSHAEVVRRNNNSNCTHRYDMPSEFEHLKLGPSSPPITLRPM